jgi:hypothetical protein
MMIIMMTTVTASRILLVSSSSSTSSSSSISSVSVPLSPRRHPPHSQPPRRRNPLPSYGGPRVERAIIIIWPNRPPDRHALEGDAPTGRRRMTVMTEEHTDDDDRNGDDGGDHHHQRPSALIINVSRVSTIHHRPAITPLILILSVGVTPCRAMAGRGSRGPSLRWANSPSDRHALQGDAPTTMMVMMMVIMAEHTTDGDDCGP